MAFSSILAYFQSFIPGSRLVDGGDCLNLAKYLFQPTTGIVALAGGGATGATQLSYGINRVDTVASDNDSVTMPPAVAGLFVVVYNNSAHSLQIFGKQANAGGGASGGDQMIANNSNTAAAVATGIAQATTVCAIYYCFATGLWKQLISA